MKAILTLFLISLLSTCTANAGARGLDAIGMTNATHGKEPDISKRLYELLISDAKVVFLQSPTFGFHWQPGVKITEIPSSANTFKALITPSSKKDVTKLIEEYKAYDGLIVYQYDKDGGFVRLKLFDADGNERILVKLPIENDGPMKDSLLKLTRRSAMTAIGGSIDFQP